MTFKVFTDLHLFSPIYTRLSIDDAMLLRKPDESTILLGDIVDLANMKEDEYTEASAFHTTLELTYGDRYINGNHERVTTNNETYVVTLSNGKRVVFAHGDIEANPTKSIKYRQKPHGAGWFKRKFIIPFIAEAEEIIERKPKEEFLERAYKLMKTHSCDYYVCGHFHPEERLTIQYKTKTVIILPRGLNYLNL